MCEYNWMDYNIVCYVRTKLINPLNEFGKFGKSFKNGIIVIKKSLLDIGDIVEGITK